MKTKSLTAVVSFKKESKDINQAHPGLSLNRYYLEVFKHVVDIPQEAFLIFPFLSVLASSFSTRFDNCFNFHFARLFISAIFSSRLFV